MILHAEDLVEAVLPDCRTNPDSGEPRINRPLSSLAFKHDKIHSRGSDSTNTRRAYRPEFSPSISDSLVNSGRAHSRSKTTVGSTRYFGIGRPSCSTGSLNRPEIV